MRCWSDTGLGRFDANASDRVYVPYGWKHDQSKRLVVWCHGAGGTYEIGPIERQVIEAIGAPWVLSLLGGLRTWGADAGSDAIDEVWDWARTNLAVAADKLILWGGSMGGLTATVYALDNPASVAAVGCAIPAIDPEHVRLNDPAGGANTTAIEGWYGAGEVPAPKQAYQRGADWDDAVDLAIWYSTDDPFTPAASTVAFAADSGASLHSLGAVGHSYSAIAAAVASFLVVHVDV